MPPAIKRINKSREKMLAITNIIRNVPKAHIAPKAHRFCQRQKHRIIAFTRIPFREIATSLCSSQ